MDDEDQASGVNLVVPPNLFLVENPDVDFRETSFFKDSTGQNHELPSPSEVDERKAKIHGLGHEKWTGEGEGETDSDPGAYIDRVFAKRYSEGFAVGEY